MSMATEPETKRRGINLVALAKPYFGLIVLTTGLLTAFGVVSMLRMPSGIYPEVAFPRIVVVAQSPGLAVKDVEVAVTRPIEEGVSIVLGVIRVRSKSVRGAAQLEIDFAPGTDMIQALNDIRARMAEVGAQLPTGTTSITERQTPSVFPIISFVVTGGKDPASLHDYAFYDLRPRISRIGDVSYVTVQGGDIREILVEVDPQALVASGLSIADVADRLGKEHRLKAVGRLDREVLQYQVLADTLATDPLDLRHRDDLSRHGLRDDECDETDRARNDGMIIQVGSALAYRPIPLQSAYCGAKHAIRGFTNSLRSELLHDGSRVLSHPVMQGAISLPPCESTDSTDASMLAAVLSPFHP